MKSKLLGGFLIAALVATSAISPAFADGRSRIGNGGITSSEGDDRGSYQSDSSRNDFGLYNSFDRRDGQRFRHEEYVRRLHQNDDFIAAPAPGTPEAGVNTIPWDY